MKLIIIATVLVFVMMSGIAVAEGDQTYGMMSSECPNCIDCTTIPDFPYVELPYDTMTTSATTTTTTTIEKNWLYGRRNFVPSGIEPAYWDFEEGSNCELPFKNQHPDIASFFDVPATRLTPLGYGPDHPSYVRVGGGMCGTTRCYMNIYPVDRGHDWIYVVNGAAAFSPVTCCVSDECWTGECYPGRNARIEFKSNTTCVSFLASTGTNLYIRLYDEQGNWMYSGTIYRTIDRVDSEPSNFTRFFIYSPDRNIRKMTLSGAFNGWHIDDLFAGGRTGYLTDAPYEPTEPDVPDVPYEPFNYRYVAERALELEGVPYLEYGLGHDWILKEYLDSKQLQDGDIMEYWNPDIKAFEEGTGISDEGLILWAYNYDSQDLAGTSFVKWCTAAKMAKHDFKVDVDPCDAKPGDVVFMDVDGDGTIDNVGIVVPPNQWDEDILTSTPRNGVQYWDASDLTGITGYKRLDSNIKGGHNPIPGH